MGALRFYGQVFRFAFTRTPSIAQDFLFGLFITAGITLYVLKRAGMIADESTWMAQISGWQIAAIVLGSIFVIRLLLAPYWLYKEVLEKAAIGSSLQITAELERLGTGIADDRRELIQKISEIRRAVDIYRGDKLDRFFLAPRRIMAISGGLEDRFMERPGFEAKWREFAEATARKLSASGPKREDFDSEDAHVQACVLHIHRNDTRLNSAARNLVAWLMNA